MTFIRTFPVGYIAVPASRSVLASDEDNVLEADPSGGTVTLTLPTTLPIGWFTSVRQTGTGTVDFVAGGGATVESTAGATPALSAQWVTVSIDKVDATTWVVTGSIA